MFVNWALKYKKTHYLSLWIIITIIIVIFCTESAKSQQFKVICDHFEICETNIYLNLYLSKEINILILGDGLAP